MPRQPGKTLFQLEAEEAAAEAEVQEQSKPTERKLVIRHVAGLLQIGWNTGGEVPKELSGRYTRREIAESAISDYMRRRNEQAVG